MILTICIFFAILIANGVSTEHVRVIAKAGNGEKIPIDISVKDGSVTTISGQPYPVQPFFKPSANLYDFNKHLEARKLIEEGICFVKKFRGTYEQMKNVVDGAVSAKTKVSPTASENWNIPGKEIKAGELKETVGPTIAEFCSGYKVVWMNMNKKVIKQQEMVVKREWNSTLDAGFDPKTGWGANAGLTYGNDDGWTGGVNGGWTQAGGLGAKGRLNYDNGNGFSAGIGGGWNERGGWSASAGLKWTFRK